MSIAGSDMSESCRFRDDLAWRRTVFANERTLLAYARTSLAMVAAGVTLIKFFDEFSWTALGTFIGVGGVLVGLIGVRRYDRARRALWKEAPEPGES